MSKMVHLTLYEEGSADVRLGLSHVSSMTSFPSHGGEVNMTRDTSCLVRVFHLNVNVTTVKIGEFTYILVHVCILVPYRSQSTDVDVYEYSLCRPTPTAWMSLTCTWIG